MAGKKSKSAKIQGLFDGRYELTGEDLDAQKGVDVLRISRSKLGKSKAFYKLEMSSKGLAISGNNGLTTGSKKIFPLSKINKFFVFNFDKQAITISTTDDNTNQKWACVLRFKSQKDADKACDLIEMAKKDSIMGRTLSEEIPEENQGYDSDGGGLPSDGSHFPLEYSNDDDVAQRRMSIPLSDNGTAERPNNVDSHMYKDNDDDSFMRPPSVTVGVESTPPPDNRRYSEDDDGFAAVLTMTQESQPGTYQDYENVGTLNSTGGYALPDSTVYYDNLNTRQEDDVPNFYDNDERYRRDSSSGGSNKLRRAPLEILYKPNGHRRGSESTNDVDSNRRYKGAFQITEKDWIIEEGRYNPDPDQGFVESDQGIIYLYCARSLRPVEPYGTCESSASSDRMS